MILRLPPRLRPAPREPETASAPARPNTTRHGEPAIPGHLSAGLPHRCTSAASSARALAASIRNAGARVHVRRSGARSRAARTVDARVGNLARRQGPDRLPARLDTARPWRVWVCGPRDFTHGGRAQRAGPLGCMGGVAPPGPGRTPFESPARHAAGEGGRRRCRPALDAAARAVNRRPGRRSPPGPCGKALSGLHGDVRQPLGGRAGEGCADGAKPLSCHARSPE